MRHWFWLVLLLVIPGVRAAAEGGATIAAADKETNVYWTMFEELRSYEKDIQVLDRQMKGKVTARDADSANAKYKELKLTWDADRKKLKDLKVVKYADMKELAQTMLDQQDAWACNAVFVIDQENKATGYFKGQSTGYDQDRGPAMMSAAREKATAAKKAYEDAKKSLGAKLDAVNKS